MLHLVETFFFVVTVITSMQCATLLSSHTEIEALKTSNVSLECRLSDENSSDFYTISTLRILKFHSDVEKWRPVAEIWDSEKDPRIIDNLSFSAVGEMRGSPGNDPENAKGTVTGKYFLKLVWTLANNETSGRYRCDIIGSSEDYAVVWEKSPVVDLIERPNMTANEVHDILIKQKTDIEIKLKEQKGEIESGIMKKLQEAAIIKNTETKEWRRNMEQKLSDMKDIQLLLLTGFLEYWPEGVYGLAQPSAGCPANIGVTWTTGYRQHHTESSSRNYDEISTINHFYGGVLSRSGTSNYMFQYFCMVISRSVGPLWPKGSYCIAMYTGTCPEGFSSGHIYWEDEDSECANSGNLPQGSYRAYNTLIHYCCRSDGPADTPIYLPKTKPFYLYRYKGTCQRVVGMSVTEEYMLFDTDSSGRSSGFVPDVTTSPNIKLQFCYYEQ